MSPDRKLPPPPPDKGRSLRAPTLPFFIAVGLLLSSYVGSLVTRALDSYFGFVDVAALLIGLPLILIAAPPVQLIPRGQADRFEAGMLYTGGSAALLAIWPFIVVWFVFPPGEGAHTACQDALGAGDGRILGTTRTLFPAQIHCDTTQGTSMASVYSGWSSAGLSSVTVLLVAVVIFGIWLMATQGRKAA